jgi:hypothetical protein
VETATYAVIVRLPTLIASPEVQSEAFAAADDDPPAAGSAKAPVPLLTGDEIHCVEEPIELHPSVVPASNPQLPHPPHVEEGNVYPLQAHFPLAQVISDPQTLAQLPQWFESLPLTLIHPAVPQSTVPVLQRHAPPAVQLFPVGQVPHVIVLPHPSPLGALPQMREPQAAD